MVWGNHTASFFELGVKESWIFLNANKLRKLIHLHFSENYISVLKRN